MTEQILPASGDGGVDGAPVSQPETAPLETAPLETGQGVDEAKVLLLAALIANDDKRWHHRRPDVCWDEVRLDYGRGDKQCDISRKFGLGERTLLNHKTREVWIRMSVAACEHLHRAVSLAKQLRRVVLEGRKLLGRRSAKRALQAFAGDRAVAISPPLGERTLPVVAPWSTLANGAQLPPEGAWRTWMMMGGRGAGKTRAGAEWVRGLVEAGLAKRIALVGPSLHDVREVMIEGPSGLCAIAPEGLRPTYEVTRRRLVWPPVGACKGAVAFAFSAEDPDSLRGPQFDLAWCDEIGAWANDLKTWSTLAFAMRLGQAPRIMATTTPRPRALVKMLAEKAETQRGGVAITRAGTRANAANLAPDFVAGLEEDYGGTELGRQELDGELIEDLAGALWSRGMIEEARARVEDAEKLERVVVAVDPPAGATGRSDACGIIVAGVKGGIVFVLQDATVRGLKPADWAERVIGVAQGWGAHTVVAESNQGGEMVRAVLDGAGAKDRGIRVKLEHAKASKRERAEPVSMLYSKARVRHVRVLKELEDEMCSFGVTDVEGRRARSPDRVDALVWAVNALLGKKVRPRMEVM